MNPHIAILLQEIYAATDKAMATGQVHPVEIIGAVEMQLHALHRQFTDQMIKAFPTEGTEVPPNVTPMKSDGN
jgi:hypothetical protein